MFVDPNSNSGLGGGVEEKQTPLSTPGPQAPRHEAEAEGPLEESSNGVNEELQAPPPPPPVQPSQWEFERGDIVDMVKELVSSYKNEILRPAIKAGCQSANMPVGLADFVEGPLVMSLLLTTFYCIVSMVFITAKISLSLLPAVLYQVTVHGALYLWGLLGMSVVSLFLLIITSSTLLAFKLISAAWLPSVQPQIRRTVLDVRDHDWAAISTSIRNGLQWAYTHAKILVLKLHQRRRARRGQRIAIIKIVVWIAWIVLLTSLQAVVWIARKGVDLTFSIASGSHPVPPS